VTDLDDVHDEAAAVGEVAAGHIGADHPPVLLRGGLDGVDLEGAGEQVRAARHVARRVDALDARAQMVVDEDAAAGLGRDSMPEPSSHSRFVRMPVAMMTTSAKIGSPFLKESFGLPFNPRSS